MIDRVKLTDLQIEVAHLFFALPASQGYVVAGGAALLASELIQRPTQDLDLFAHAPIDSVTPAQDSLLRAIDQRGWRGTVIHASTSFCRLVAGGMDDEVLVDLALDSPPISPPIATILGPTLAPFELAGRKVLALFGRAEARDFADVFLLAERFGKGALLEQAAAGDAGFDRQVLADMMRTLDRFADDEIPLPHTSVADARLYFTQWADDLSAASPG